MLLLWCWTKFTWIEAASCMPCSTICAFSVCTMRHGLDRAPNLEQHFPRHASRQTTWDTSQESRTTEIPMINQDQELPLGPRHLSTEQPWFLRAKAWMYVLYSGTRKAKDPPGCFPRLQRKSMISCRQEGSQTRRAPSRCCASQPTGLLQIGPTWCVFFGMGIPRSSDTAAWFS